MIKLIKSESGHEYKIDTDQVTCTCADYKYRRSHMPLGSMDHLCKHLKSELDNNPNEFPAEYSKPKSSFDHNGVVQDDKVRYPRALFDRYVRSLNMLADGGSVINKHEVCGSYRRMCDLCSDLDLLVTLSNPLDKTSIREFYNKIKLAFPNHEVLAEGDLKLMIMLDSYVHLDVLVVPEDSWGSALMHFTGSKLENIRLRRKALSLGCKLSQYGVIRDSDGMNLS